MKNSNGKRIGLLIDAENLEIQARNDYGAKIDYQKLLENAGNGQLLRAQYFKPQDKLTHGWVKLLTDWGYEVNGTLKNSDAWLIISAVTLASKCDVIRLVAGDADYIPLVWFLQSKGVRVEIWMFEECTSKELCAIADAFIPMSTELLLEKAKSNLIPITPKRRKCYV